MAVFGVIRVFRRYVGGPVSYRIRVQHFLYLFKVLIVVIIEVAPVLVDVGYRLYLEPNSVSELVDRMEKKGLISKRKDPDKKNVVRLTITEAGQRLCEKVMGEELIQDLISSLNEEEQKQLWSLLRKVYRASLKELGAEDDILLLP